LLRNAHVSSARRSRPLRRRSPARYGPESRAGCVPESAPLTHTGTALMDTEHINAIGNALADLTRRTQDLRGYL
jgi:hypothetical protein